MNRQERLLDVPGGHCAVVVDKPATNVCAGFVCAHGLTGDKSGPGSILSRLTREAAGYGVASARFDFQGSGDSPGDWYATNFATMTANFLAVAQLLQGEVGHDVPLVFGGLSTGGLVAVLAAARALEPVSGLLLLSTDMWEEDKPERFVESVRTGEFHEHEQMPLERQALTAHATLAALKLPKLLIYGEDDELLVSELPKLVRCGLETSSVGGAGHLFENAAGREQLHRLVRAYFERLSEGD